MSNYFHKNSFLWQLFHCFFTEKEKKTFSFLFSFFLFVYLPMKI